MHWDIINNLLSAGKLKTLNNSYIQSFLYLVPLQSYIQRTKIRQNIGGWFVTYNHTELNWNQKFRVLRLSLLKRKYIVQFPLTKYIFQELIRIGNSAVDTSGLIVQNMFIGGSNVSTSKFFAMHWFQTEAHIFLRFYGSNKSLDLYAGAVYASRKIARMLFSFELLYEK